MQYRTRTVSDVSYTINIVTLPSSTSMFGDIFFIQLIKYTLMNKYFGSQRPIRNGLIKLSYEKIEQLNSYIYTDTYGPMMFLTYGGVITLIRQNCSGPNCIIKDLPSVLILIIAHQTLNDSLCCSNKYNWCFCRFIGKLYTCILLLRLI